MLSNPLTPEEQLGADKAALCSFVSQSANGLNQVVSGLKVAIPRVKPTDANADLIKEVSDLLLILQSGLSHAMSLLPTPDPKS